MRKDRDKERRTRTRKGIQGQVEEAERQYVDKSDDD